MTEAFVYNRAKKMAYEHRRALRGAYVDVIAMKANDVKKPTMKMAYDTDRSTKLAFVNNSAIKAAFVHY